MYFNFIHHMSRRVVHNIWSNVSFFSLSAHVTNHTTPLFRSPYLSTLPSHPPSHRDLFQYERLEPYLKMKTGYEQLFVGREGTGTPFHNAANWNMFYMVS